MKTPDPFDILNDLTTTLIPPTPDSPPHHVFTIDPSEPSVLHFHIDNSSLEKFQTCPRSAEYYILRRRELNAGRRPLDFGGAVHEALAAFLTGQPIDTCLQRLHEYLDSKDPCAPGDFRTAENAEELFLGWVRYHSPFKFRPVRDANDSPIVEQAFDLKLAEIPVGQCFPCSLEFLTGSPHPTDPAPHYYCDRVIVHWTGRIDAVVSHDVFGSPWVMDHKTTSIGGDGYFRDFDLSQQMIGYCYAYRELLGVQPRGLLLSSLINRKPTKTGVAREYHLTPYEYSDWHYEEWLSDTSHQVSDFIANLLRGNFPKAPKHCMNKYGSCPYHSACTLDPVSRIELLTSPTFRNVSWNPLSV